MFLGSRAAAAPYVMISKLFTILYFSYFLILLPFLQYLHNFIIITEEIIDDFAEKRFTKKPLVMVDSYR
jgi:hypothetical protein